MLSKKLGVNANVMRKTVMQYAWELFRKHSFKTFKECLQHSWDTAKNY